MTGSELWWHCVTLTWFFIDSTHTNSQKLCCSLLPLPRRNNLKKAFHLPLQGCDLNSKFPRWTKCNHISPGSFSLPFGSREPPSNGKDNIVLEVGGSQWGAQTWFRCIYRLCELVSGMGSTPLRTHPPGYLRSSLWSKEKKSMVLTFKHSWYCLRGRWLTFCVVRKLVNDFLCTTKNKTGIINLRTDKLNN